MRILVCGGRNYTNRKILEEILSDYWYSRSHEQQNEFVLIHGDARGADRLARDWCLRTCYEWCHAPFPADWNKYGRSAGPIRNKQMLDEGKPSVVLAFPGGKGTANMIKLAIEAGVEVIQVDEEGHIRHRS